MPSELPTADDEPVAVWSARGGPPEADPQTRVTGFIGRDPTWLPRPR